MFHDKKKKKKKGGGIKYNTYIKERGKPYFPTPSPAILERRKGTHIQEFVIKLTV